MSYVSCHQPRAKIRSCIVSFMRQSAIVKHGNTSRTTVKRAVVNVEVRGKKVFIADNYNKQNSPPSSDACVPVLWSKRVTAKSVNGPS